MTRPPGDDDDARAFDEAMRGARPLPGRGTGGAAPDAASGPVPPPDARGRRAPSPTAAPPLFLVDERGDTISGRARDVSVKVMRALAAGDPPVDARIDLHGRVREDVALGLERAVAVARARGCRTLLVIHGRGRNSDPGGPVLRPAAWAWLGSSGAARAGVLAFVSARPRDGGSGATVVLLRS